MMRMTELAGEEAPGRCRLGASSSMGGGQAGGPRGAAGGFAGRLELSLGGGELALQRLDAALLQPALLAPSPAAEPRDELAENEAEGGGDKNREEQAGREINRQRPEVNLDRLAVGDREIGEQDRDHQDEEPTDRPHESIPLPTSSRSPAAQRAAATVSMRIQAVAELLAGLEERDVLLVDAHAVAGARVAPETRIAALHREGAETSELDAVAPRQPAVRPLQHFPDHHLPPPLVSLRPHLCQR